MPAMTEVTSQASPPEIDPLIAGREAVARHAWDAAFEQLSVADRQGSLSAADLESLALAAFFAAQPAAELEVKERAFKAHETEGDTLRAAYLALDLARTYGFAGNHAIASAWRSRAERIIGPEGDSYVHGYLALVKSEAARGTGDVDTALALAERAVEIGRAAADADLKAHALTNLGAIKIASGATSDGLLLMEEASIAAVNGELTPFTSGVTACRMIGACRDLTDYRRASEWIEATEKYCERQSLSGFPGICRIHRAEVAVVSGAWERAETELVRATTELASYNAAPPQADGFYAMGDIRRLRGDFDGAEAALREAHGLGRSPQPALALVRLAQGKVKAALTAINAAVVEETWDRWARGRLLQAQVEILIAAGEAANARTAIDELTEIVAGYPSPALEAGRQIALARVLIAEGDPKTAAHELRAAIKGWREVGSPFEVARARMVLSRALRAVQDEDGADFELQAAIGTFRELGAKVDLEAAERELRDVEDRRSGPQALRKTLMFTDIVGSTRLAEALGDAAWERILRWHDEMLRSQVASGGGEIVNSTGDGFFAAFDGARQAIDTAISIQRALLEHRSNTGFAISVRIGLHSTEANRRGADYSGIGVHIAARVGALAEGGEILATQDVLAEAGATRTSGERSTPIRGVSEPISLAAVEWA